MDKMKNSVVFYHANCTDGFGAAFAAWKSLGDSAEYLPISYGDPVPVGVMNKDVYILDFSFPQETLENIIALSTKVILLDHHKTAFENYAGSEREFFTQSLPNDGLILLDNSKSGALIAWEYFHPEKDVPKLIQHISDRDLWKFKLEGTRSLHATMQSCQPWSFFVWNLWSNDAVLEDMYLDGDAILRSHDAQVKSICAYANPCTIYHKHSGLPSSDTFKGMAVNCSPQFASDVGNILSKEFDSFGLCWHFDSEINKAKVSLRSTGDYDVSSIAKLYGGGGHKNAAGFSVPLQVLMLWL